MKPSIPFPNSSVAMFSHTKINFVQKTHFNLYVTTYKQLNNIHMSLKMISRDVVVIEHKAFLLDLKGI